MTVKLASIKHVFFFYAHLSFFHREYVSALVDSFEIFCTGFLSLTPPCLPDIFHLQVCGVTHKQQLTATGSKARTTACQGEDILYFGLHLLYAAAGFEAGPIFQGDKSFCQAAVYKLLKHFFKVFINILFFMLLLTPYTLLTYAYQKDL